MLAADGPRGSGAAYGHPGNSLVWYPSCKGLVTATHPGLINVMSFKMTWGLQVVQNPAACMTISVE